MPEGILMHLLPLLCPVEMWAKAWVRRKVFDVAVRVNESGHPGLPAWMPAHGGRSASRVVRVFDGIRASG